MAGNAHPSRFSPTYLAARHAGACFFFIALGLACGVAWRCLVQPTRYRAEARSSFTLEPAGAAFDLDAKGREWLGVLADREDRQLLGVNLRHAVKLAATRDLRLDAEDLRAEIAAFEPAATFSASLLPASAAARLGPAISVTRRDIAANLDFQSLAVIMSDLDPARDAASWDFSFFDIGASGNLDDFVIARPGPDDPFFRVFYHLHDVFFPNRPASSPEEAWRTAVDELTDRLDREAQFAGGGGFGHMARRELVREISAIPALAANGLYHASGWFHGDGDFRDQLELWAERWGRRASLEWSMEGTDGGWLGAAMDLELYPLAYPRDTVLTRVPPPAAATLLAFIAERERLAVPLPVVEARPAPPPPPEPEAVITVTELPDENRPETPPPAMEEVVDAAAEDGRRESILGLEQELQKARLDRDAALRRLETARNGEKRLSNEALAARNRADRLRERYDAAVADAGCDEPEASVEETRLLLDRDAVRERLAVLLQTCTEEHPFVRQARRELAAIEFLLAEMSAGRDPAAAAKAREARLADIRLEWEAALVAAENLEERLRRLAVEIESALAAVAAEEKRMAGLEGDLARIKMEKPRTIVRPRAAPAVVVTPPAPEPAPRAVRVEPPPVRSSSPPAKPVFGATPTRVPLRRTPPGWEAPICGLLAGLALAALWMIVRELTAFKFATVYEAKRLVDLPLLAALPAYGPKSFRAAARTMKGDVAGSRAGSMVFTPMPVEFVEPAAVARRGSLVPVRRRPRLLAWVAGFLLLGCAYLLHSASEAGLARPPVAFSGELSLPQSAYRQPGAAGEEEWGDLP